MAIEEWRSVVGREAEYEISSHGRVRSLPRFRRGRGGHPTRVFGRILSTANRNGYRGVLLGRQTSAFIHRLVATAFVPNPLLLPEVNHINGDKADNRAENLEWVSHRGNALHASQMGLLATGERHGRNTMPWRFQP
jgi:hypothetical protein